MKVVLYVQGIHLDSVESLIIRTGNSYVQGIHLDPGESCLVRTGNSFRSGLVVLYVQ